MPQFGFCRQTYRSHCAFSIGKTDRLAEVTLTEENGNVAKVSMCIIDITDRGGEFEARKEKLMKIDESLVGGSFIITICIFWKLKKLTLIFLVHQHHRMFWDHGGILWSFVWMWVWNYLSISIKYEETQNIQKNWAAWSVFRKNFVSKTKNESSQTNIWPVT